jgi:DNA-binding MarR family transcriptional regulator
MENQEYGTFICLSEKGKEELRNMSDAHLEFLASFLHESILEAEFKILKKLNEDSTKDGNSVESSKDLS